MRMSVTGNNNGACCNKCGKLLIQADIKQKSYAASKYILFS